MAHFTEFGGGNNGNGEHISLCFDLNPPDFVEALIRLSNLPTNLFNSVA